MSRMLEIHSDSDIRGRSITKINDTVIKAQCTTHENVQNAVNVQVNDDDHANVNVTNVMAHVTVVPAPVEVSVITAQFDVPHVPAQLNIPVLPAQFDEGESTVLYTNVHSLINKINELYMLIDRIKPKIIALTEIMAKNMQDFNMAEYNVPGYDLFVNKNPKRGGSCLYSQIKKCKRNTD